MQFTDIRSQNQFWYEGDYGSPSIGYPETVVNFTGTFRGDTLVDATPRPNGGIPRYQRQQLAALGTNEIAPPAISVQRFIFGVSNPVAPRPLPTPPPIPSTPTVTITAEPSVIQVGQTAVIRATFAPAAGDTITNTTINIGTNSLVPYSAATDRTYTYTATALGDVLFQAYAQTAKFPTWTTYKSVTVRVAPPPPPIITLTANGQSEISVAAGGSYTIAWNSSNALNCTLSENRTDGYPNGNHTITPNTSFSGPSGLLGTYTFTCTNAAGQSSASATIRSTP